MRSTSRPRGHCRLRHCAPGTITCYMHRIKTRQSSFNQPGERENPDSRPLACPATSDDGSRDATPWATRHTRTRTLTYTPCAMRRTHLSAASPQSWSRFCDAEPTTWSSSLLLPHSRYCPSEDPLPVSHVAPLNHSAASLWSRVCDALHHRTALSRVARLGAAHGRGVARDGLAPPCARDGPGAACAPRPPPRERGGARARLYLLAKPPYTTVMDAGSIW